MAHSGLTGGIFGFFLEFQLSLPLDSLDPYWSEKHEIGLFLGLLTFFLGSKMQFFPFYNVKITPSLKLARPRKTMGLLLFWV